MSWLDNNNNQESITKRFAWITAANFIGFGLSFSAPLLIVRLLSQSEYGIYKELFQLLATLIGMLNLQVAASAYYFIPRLNHDGEKKQVIFNILLFYAVLGGLVSLLFVEYPKWETLVFHDAELLPYIPLIGVVFWLWFVSSNLEGIPVALGDARSSAFYMVISHLAKSVSLIIAALAFRSVGAVIWAAIIHGVLQTTLLFIYLKRRFLRFSQPFSWRLLKEQLRNSIPYGAGDVMQVLYTDLHIYFVAHFFSPAIFAVYTIGCFQLPLLGLIESSVIQVLIPALSDLEAKGDRRGVIRVWMNSMRKMALATLPFAALMFVVRYDLITFLFTKTYQDAVPLFGVQILGSILIFLLIEPVLRAFPEMKYFSLKLSMVMLPLTGIALYAGIHYAGLTGITVAVVSLRLLAAVVTMIAIFSKLQIQWREIRNFGLILARLSLSTITAAAISSASLPRFTGAHPIIRLAACSLIFGAAFVALAIVTRIISKEEKQAIFSMLRRIVCGKFPLSLKNSAESAMLRSKEHGVAGD